MQTVYQSVVSQSSLVTKLHHETLLTDVLAAGTDGSNAAIAEIAAS